MAVAQANPSRSFFRISTVLLALVAAKSAYCQERQSGSGSKAEPAAASISYTLKITEKGAAVQAEASGFDPSKSTGFTASGFVSGTEVTSTNKEDSMVFRYAVPLDRKKIKKAGSPFIGNGRFTAFGSGLFLRPKAAGVLFNKVSLKVSVPDDWTLVTSRGSGREYEFGSLPDLLGLLICAGDYQTYEFEAPHHNAKGDPTGESTRVYVAIHGERDWDDRVFVGEFRRIVTAQMKFFGGSHPATHQFLALHICAEGEGPPDVPAFNRRAPGHDTILAFHTPNRPRDSFEFLGMLSHEHLHNWFPFAIKSNLGPWFMEGLNDYVAYRCLMAEGLHDEEQFSGMLSKWHREYKWALENPKHPIMPYRRGMIAGWIMDIELRRSSEGKLGLRDVLLELFANPPQDGIVKRDDLVSALGKAAGKDMEGLYGELVERDAAINVTGYLRGTGFRTDSTGKILIAPESEVERRMLKAILQ